MTDHLITSIIAISLGILIVIKGFKNLQKRRIIKNTPTSKIRSLAMGPVEIKATIIGSQETMTSPITQRECEYYEYKVQQEKQKKNGTYWKTIKKSHKGRYLYLQDETGTVLIDTNKATIDIASSITTYLSSMNEQAKQFLENEGITTKNFLGFTKKLRVIETILYPHQHLYVFGNAKDNPHVADGTQTKGYKDVMIGSGPHFFISDRKEEELISRTGLQSLSIFVGTTLIIGGVTALIWLL